MEDCISAETRDILSGCDALLEGHFRYTSGRHGSVYFEKIRLAQHPELVMRLAELMERRLEGLREDAEIVCAPAFGALVFGFALAYRLELPFAFLQRGSDERMKLRSGFTEVEAGRKVLMVEDVTTTGGSVRESMEVLEERGLSISAVGLLVDRTGGELDLGVPCRALLTVNAESWPPDECPLCRRGMELQTPGSSSRKVRDG
ncbi:MAG: orotate phosphoribosyltransferase [Candidatus Fermentibacteraceae bacterium]